MTAAAAAGQSEGIKWSCRTTLRKFDGDVTDYIAKFGEKEGLRRFYEENEPTEEIVKEGNLLLRVGIENLWKLLAGLAATAYSNANARLGVGNSSTAAADTQTDLLGASTAWKAQDVGYPVVGALANKKITYRSSFGSAEGNFAWQEWAVDNGAAAHILLNRKVASLGTKTTGTWQLTVDVSLA